MATMFNNDAIPASAVFLGTLKSSFDGATLTESDVTAGLINPVWPDGGRRTVFDIVRPGESTCIVVSDQTRRTAVDIVLPVLLDGLRDRGCRMEDIFFLFASGIHRRPTPAEIPAILGHEVAARFEGRIFLHDPDDAANLVEVGRTGRGHLVRVNRRAIEADRLVATGTVTYHYHAGFGGGRKAIVPGLASRDTIAFNHSLTLDPKADRIHPRVNLGILDGNPVAEEMLEAARMCDPDIIINTVLTPEDRLIGVFSGDLDAAHRVACRLAEKVCRADIREPADFVVASAGSAPNWIQSHKALYNAHRAIKEGGTVVLLAPCPEGIGDERFRYWVTRPDIGMIYRDLRNSPEVLGQTALSTKIRGADAILVTRMSGKDITDLGIRTAADADAAIRLAADKALSKGTRSPTFYVIPEARHVVPFIV